MQDTKCLITLLADETYLRFISHESSSAVELPRA